MLGEFATSKAGHDKDRLYMIVGEEEEWVYLCDGRLRGVEHPKKKRRICKTLEAYLCNK